MAEPGARSNGRTRDTVGTVYFVGAGPGDPGLITVRGAGLLVRADVVIYDRLVDQQILDLARRDAELVYVGKTPGSNSMSQTEINLLLASAARRADVVVRLKGGDPFVFGRGAEEASFLRRQGIPFAIVPGVPSATAVPAYAGIPVTDRRCASSFAVFSGRGSNERTCEDWDDSLVSGGTAADTLVFLMAVGELENVVTGLLRAGRDQDTPAAVIQWGTTSRQKTIVCSLRGLVDRARKAGLEPPAVVVVGEVVRFSSELDWFAPREGAGDTAELLT